MNNFIKSCDNWTEREILQRYEILKNKALEIWKIPKTDYKPKKEYEFILTLSDCIDINMSGYLVEGINFMGEEYNINYFADAYEIIVKILYSKDPLKMKALLKTNKHGSIFFEEENNGWNTRKIDDNLFLHVGYNTNIKIIRLKTIFDEYQIDYDELEFYIKKSDNTEYNIGEHLLKGTDKTVKLFNVIDEKILNKYSDVEK